ncbi:MAG TPA: hypothetical protein VFR18_24060 [Terriglobia bacterium]|nr:hypothetical protein [Terriglobia bacterium]
MTSRYILSATAWVVTVWFLVSPHAALCQAEWSVVVDGAPVPLPRPVVGNGRDLFVPLLPVTRALGFQVEIAPALKTLRLRRGAGAPIEYDGRSGEIRYGPVVAGQIRDYQQLIISEPVEELLFPVDGLITLLAVDVQMDVGGSTVYISSSTNPFNVPSTHGMGLSNLDYSVGITKAGDSEGYYTLLKSGALAGGIPLNSTLLLAGERSDVRLQQGTVIAQLGDHRELTVGDQSSISGPDALISSVRGIGYSAPFQGFEAAVYGGRTAGTVGSQIGAASVANYDSTIVGGTLRTRRFDGDLSFAASGFSGPERKGTSAGAAFTKTTTKHQLRAQVVFGTFSGLGLRSLRPAVADVPSSVEETTPVLAEKIQADGPALGISFFDTYKPIEPLAFTLQLERYGANFLTPREDSKFNAQSTQRASASMRPLSGLSLHGGVSRRKYLAGDPDVLHAFDYGANGIIPAVPWLQLGYFRVIQNGQNAASRLRMSQYSATMASLQYSGSVMYSDLNFSTSRARTLNVMLSRNLTTWGQLTLHDQLELDAMHRYGAEWRLNIPRGDLRIGLDRWTSMRSTDGYFVPIVGFGFRVGDQRLVATYTGERGTHTFTFTIGGPLVVRDDLRRDADGRLRVISQATLKGRVFLDTDGDNVFDPETEIPMPGITVWLDEQVSAVTDAAGMFRFDRMKAGTHGVRADLAEVPADMIFSDSGERRVALLPFRENVQNFAIVRTGSLTGKVTYLDHSDPEKPVQKSLGDARVIADSDHDTYSDIGGNITIGSLKPGSYQLKVDPETVPEGYVASVEPPRILIRAGEVVRGVQIRLALQPRSTIITDLPKQQSVSSPE